MSFERSNSLRARFHAAIPGGSHTYAKGDDQYPEHAAPYLVRGKGCRVWDVDGNQFIEYGMGLRAVTLGHAYQPVIDAAQRQIALGMNFTRPALLELECAEALLALISGADMVKFAKNGSDITTAAVKLARAYTGRDLVAVCAQQPFFSADDWFIGVTPMGAGVPKGVRELTLKFNYNDVDSLRMLFGAHPGEIACVVMEPATAAAEPANDFLARTKRLCEEQGALLIFDEMITGFRWDVRGAQHLYGVVPDLSTFGKALGNGFAISALLGRREIMELGGLQHSRERVFLLSTTHGAESSGLAAAIAVMQAYQQENPIGTMYRQGERLCVGLRAAIGRHGLLGHVEIVGRPCNLVYTTRDAERQPSQQFRTLFMSELIRHGILAPSFVVSAAHSDTDIDLTIEAVDAALAVYRRALDYGILGQLNGRPVKPVMRTFN